MESSNLDQIDMAITALCELWGKEVSVGFFAIYRSALLSQLTEQEAIKGLSMAFVRKTFGFPKPADIIEWIKGTKDDNAVEAFGKLMIAIERHGPNQSIIFDDPKIAHVVHMLGGWQQVNQWLTKDIVWNRKEFTSIYKALPDNIENQPLIGLGEISCREWGKPGPGRYLIGDEKKCIIHEKSDAEKQVLQIATQTFGRIVE